MDFGAGELLVQFEYRGRNVSVKASINGYAAAWLKEHPEWKAAGDLRTLAYNSPFVPGLVKYSEAQIPIEPTAGR
jgi:hypothetical protein